MLRRTFSSLGAALALALAAPPMSVAAQGVAGRWLVDVTLDAGSGRATFVFQVEGNAITGTYGGVLGEAAVTGTIEGNLVRFGFESPDAGVIRFEGTLAGDTMEGTCEYGALGTGSFRGTRAT
jgi:hypothetical protein